MKEIADAFYEADDVESLLQSGKKAHFQRIFAAQAVRSYLLLSLGMGTVAFSLPILLLMTGGYDGHYSISFFYHVSELCRNILVGCLCATGVFLFLFHGLSSLENWLLNIAGVGAVSVALNPMASEQCPVGESAGVSIHAFSAIVFFLCLAVVAVGLSKGRIRFIKSDAKRRFFTVAYNTAGLLMIAMPAMVAAAHFLGRQTCESHWIFWIECTGIWAFSAYWFLKTYEYRVLLKVRLFDA
jgi:hypothetical protein